MKVEPDACAKSIARVWKPRTVLVTVSFVMITLFLCSLLVSDQYTNINGIWDGSTLMFVSSSIACRSKRCPRGSEALPRGIVEAASDMELKPLWRSSKKKALQKSLLAIAAGIQQKRGVDQIARKFPVTNFTIMLFHYDGVVDRWSDLPWFGSAIHIVAINQTKWWFAKRFMHPDVVSAYEFIFVWDEDLGVDHFRADRYLEIVRKEGLQISQPALDPSLSSEVHHRITVRNKKTRVHRRIYMNRGREYCGNNSTQPPCTGWVEMMAPVFSRSAWRCAWHLIQNDLVHGWGMDMKLGYCAEGDPTRNVGVVDTQYLIHRGIPSLGGGVIPIKKSSADDHTPPPAAGSGVDARKEIRRRAQAEMRLFKKRWTAAVKDDKCWIDPYDRRSRRQ
ncbi:uncharacterized protein LOC9661890 [Selaginella moellendorffii]|uniref:uncharacterized protein LOC9661890 n=1 Tax=Selaginella moellendorffii TaxID=88036 RepID=UPI000D1C6CBF|nr:uncharacterized protein LOC9661890 [Selaginella moellendorffii]|eukprot:XP_024543280.1 uncharacterized protein LOC9661890 [Selaginella moellendorffii]